MKISIEGKNIELTKALKDYVTDKLKRLEKHYESIIKGHEVKVKLSVAKNPRITNDNVIEVTIFLDGKIIRSEQASEGMYASIDLIEDKLERQLQKYKSKVYRSYQHNERPLPNLELPETIQSKTFSNNNQLQEGKIIKSKKFHIHPMTPEEAITHLDLISHDFYVFINSNTNQINTIYKRKDGNYGLIEPVI
ncbi:MAG: ribosome-associated translation inhibitor RaiA [Candidatus Melainabacteria bacterium]|nr:ribosome-associated translation inhibitor RaiA [Candidatus Melainabacteria bacterium]